jgi:type IV fimbrial biogenesis protein FimT
MKTRRNGCTAPVAVQVAGVTLIELLITLSISTLLLAVAIPSLSSFIDDNRLSSRTFELVGAMNLARSEAIKRGAWVSLCKTKHPEATPTVCQADAGWEQGLVIFVDNTQEIGNQLGVIDGADQIVKIYYAEDRIRISAGNSFALGIAYNPDGLGLGIKADGSTGTASNTFNLCLNNKGTAIVTNRSGRIRISQGDC